MHDLRRLREDGVGFLAAMARRNGEAAVLAREVLALDAENRRRTAEEQARQTRRNELARLVAEGRRRGEDTAALQAEATALRPDAGVQQDNDERNRAFLDALDRLPNRLDPDVPDGPDEAFNRVEKTFGPPPAFGFTPREHDALGEALGMMDFAAAAKLSGSRFVVLRGALARLERALGQFMLDVHTTEHGYTECAVPLLVNSFAVRNTGQLPKFEDDLFKTADQVPFYLIPTAEVPLTNLGSDDIVGSLPGEALPLRFTALTECFRSEAGSAGRDTRGMLRQHQFRKVELVSIVRPEDSPSEHERMTRCAETILERLFLPYRRALLCSGDTGFSAAKTYDLEVWLPGQGRYREISSCSNCRDFQARRMNARFRRAAGAKPEFVHTLNGSGVAVGRALIAVMENYQQADGSITVPETLGPYMGGLARIG